MQYVKLGDACDIIGGGTPSKSEPEYWNGNIRWASVRDMKSTIISTTEFKISDLGLRKSSSNLIPANNVVIASRVGLGKVCWINEDTAINQDLRAIIPKEPSKLLKEYLFWWLRYSAKKIIDAGTGATVQGVTLPFLKSLDIPLPSLDDQRVIVAKLTKAYERLDEAISLNTQNISKTQAIFRSTLENIFSDINTSGWESRTVSSLGNVQTGTTPKTSEKNNYGDYIPFIKPGDFRQDGTLKYDNASLSKTGLASGRLISAHSVLMVCIGATITKAGYCDRDVSCNQQINAVSLGDEITAKFVYFQMITDRFKTKILNEAPKTTLPIINKGNWSKLLLKIPSHNEMETVVKKLNKLSSTTDSLGAFYAKKSEYLNALKVSLLEEVFSESAVK